MTVEISRERRRARGLSRLRSGSLRAVLLAVIAFWCLFPFLWLVMTSLKRPTQAATQTNLFAGPFTLDNYVNVMAEGFGYNIRNSVIVAGQTTLLCVVIGVLAAYALARLEVPKRALYMGLILALSLYPAISLIPPLYQLWRSIGLLNTYPGLVLPYTAFNLPLTIFLLAAFFASIPQELEEAALIDGASRFRAFWQVILPLGAPGIFTAGILTFVSSWNEYLIASTFSPRSLASQTVPVAVASFQGTDPFDRPIATITAACVIVIIPMIVVALVFQRRIVSGLTGGAVKG